MDDWTSSDDEPHGAMDNRRAQSQGAGGAKAARHSHGNSQPASQHAAAHVVHTESDSGSDTETASSAETGETDGLAPDGRSSAAAQSPKKMSAAAAAGTAGSSSSKVAPRGDSQDPRTISANSEMVRVHAIRACVPPPPAANASAHTAVARRPCRASCCGGERCSTSACSPPASS